MRRVRSQFLGLSVVALAMAVVGAALPGAASADPFAYLGNFGSPNGTAGGQLTFPRGVAVNQLGNGAPAGSVYVAEANTNNRISQFTADGEFVRTWGFDVIVATRPDSSAPPNSNGTGFEICDVTNGNVASDCKAGATGAAAGQLSNPTGVAIDQSNGYLYVPSLTNRRVDVFSGTGQFAGAFGWGVDTGAAAPEVCTTASTCQAAGAAGGDAGRFGTITASIPAVDPSTPGRVFVPDPGNLRVAQYATTIAGGVLTAAAFDKAFGWDVIPAGAAGLESCTIATTCQASQPTTGGSNSGQFTSGGSPTVAVDSTGAMYVTSGPLGNGTCSATAPCRIQKFAPDASSATDFGPSSGTGQLTFTAGTAGTVAAFGVAVDPDNDHVFVQRRESSTSYRVLEYDSDGNFVETHPGGNPLTTVANNNLAPGLAVSSAGRVYVSAGAGAASGQSQVHIIGPIDPPIVTIEPPTNVGATTAMLNGTIEIPPPGSPTFTTRYRFEYSSNGVDWTSVPATATPVPGGTTGVHAVSQQITGLQPGVLYSVRLVATTGPTASSTTATFTTDRSFPRVAQAYVEEVTQTEAGLGAHIDPEGLDTTYHFEWGTQPGSYPNRVPAFERQLGDGNKPVIAREQIDGLEPTSVYHYRIVAKSFCHPTDPADTTPSSVSCVTEGPDQQFETLNDCGLTEARCYEMISPADKGPIASVGETVATASELWFQAAATKSKVAYVIAFGLPDTTAGHEVSYLADRTDTGWTSSQLLPPKQAPPDGNGGGVTSQTLAMSGDLDCALQASGEALTDDAPTGSSWTADRANLFRRNSDASWTVISNLEPSFVASSAAGPTLAYEVIGMSDTSDDVCDRIVFRTASEYPGVPAPRTGGDRVFTLYRWDNGTITNVGVIPGPGGPEFAPTTPGASDTTPGGSPGGAFSNNYWNAVSRDTSRVYFTALSKLGGDVGKRAVFLREVGSSVAVDVSQSQTVSPPLAGGSANNDDSVYQAASGDGSQVFFTARYGLASNADGTAVHSSADATATSCEVDGTGCDLYRYSVADGKLTDLSVPEATAVNERGASVLGVLGASDDGEDVYFAARGQLVAGQGNSDSDNVSDGAYNVYASHGGTIEFVGKLRESDSGPALIAKSRSARWSARVTPDGDHMLFESRARVTEYDSDGRPEAYLYSADTGSTVCVSCRRDGEPSVMPSQGTFVGERPLAVSTQLTNAFTPPLTLTNDGRRVFFFSRNRLATGGVEGQDNLYQWKDGQISLLATSVSGSGVGIRFAGASVDGSDVYFSTYDSLLPQDFDGRADLYDARIGGGFPEPPEPPAGCDPLAGGCQGGGFDSVSSDTKTQSSSESGNAKAEARKTLAVSRLSKKARRKASRTGRVPIKVRASSTGRVSLTVKAKLGKKVRRVGRKTVRIRKAGATRVNLRLNSRARAALRKGKALRVTVQVRQSGARTRTRSILLPGVKR